MTPTPSKPPPPLWGGGGKGGPPPLYLPLQGRGRIKEGEG